MHGCGLHITQLAEQKAFQAPHGVWQWHTEILQNQLFRIALPIAEVAALTASPDGLLEG